VAEIVVPFRIASEFKILLVTDARFWAVVMVEVLLLATGSSAVELKPAFLVTAPV
jgi:hypothetical protein